MSMHVEWARATGTPSLIDEDEAREWSDSYGQQIDRGNVGLCFAEVVMEGTRAEIAAWARRVIELVGGA